MPDEPDLWVEGLGVTFNSADEDFSAPETARVTTGSAPGSSLDSAAGEDAAEISAPDESDAGQVVPADIVGGPGDSDGSTLIIDAPIGVLQLLSSTQADAAGQKFNVTVASSAKDPLLFGASVAGTSVGTVKISQPAGTTTL